MTHEHSPPITPHMKVAELLDSYPELERVLIDLAPPFRKLRNPVLRRTIARVTSLEKAAQVADLPLREMITTLRTAAGQTVANDDLADDTAEVSESTEGPADWVDPARVVWTVDADALLSEGAEPLHATQEKTRSLRSGELGLIRSSFRPAPLIEVLQKRGFHVAVVHSEERFATFVAPDLSD